MYTSEDETHLVRPASQGTWMGMGKSTLSVVALLLVVVATAIATTLATMSVAMTRAGVRDAQGLEEMPVKPAYENCAKMSENCLGPRCCKVSGVVCYKTSDTEGTCMKSCTPGGTNGTCEEVPLPTKQVAERPGNS